MSKKELLQKIQEVNQWYFEQLERYNNGEIKETTLKSYKTRHRQRRNKIIKNMQTQQKELITTNKPQGLFSKW